VKINAVRNGLSHRSLTGVCQSSSSKGTCLQRRKLSFCKRVDSNLKGTKLATIAAMNVSHSGRPTRYYREILKVTAGLMDSDKNHNLSFYG
jgi:hypothetical protein